MLQYLKLLLRDCPSRSPFPCSCQLTSLKDSFYFKCFAGLRSHMSCRWSDKGWCCSRRETCGHSRTGFIQAFSSTTTTQTTVPSRTQMQMQLLFTSKAQAWPWLKRTRASEQNWRLATTPLPILNEWSVYSVVNCHDYCRICLVSSFDSAAFA